MNIIKFLNFSALFIAILLGSGCKTMETVSDTLKLPKVSSKSTYAQFPKNQMPHVMLKNPVVDGKLTSKYGYRLNPAGIPMPKKHSGIDYSAATGTSILAAADGVIIEKRVSSSYGNLIRISHENGFSTFYAHMDSFAATLEKGSKVSKKQVIGTVGTTGRSTGPHLHFELRYRGKKVDPLF